MKRSALLIVIALALTGCSYTREIGVVGTKRFTKVQLGSLTAPGQTLIVVEDTQTHSITLLTPMGGNGVVPAFLQAGGIVGAGFAFGSALGESDTTIHNTVVDKPPAPPRYPPQRPRDRPPINRPPLHKQGRGWN